MRDNLVIGLLAKPKRILDYWATMPNKIQNEINIYLQSRSISEIEIYTYENEKNEVVKNSAVYHIDNKAYWSNGVKVTSADFKLWFDIKIDPLSFSYIKEPWINAELDIIDEKSFEIIFDPPYQFIENNAPIPVPEHLMKKSWEDWKTINKDLPKEELKDSWNEWLDKYTSIENPPELSNGLYKLKSWTTDSIELSINEAFNEVEYPHRNIKTIKFKFFKTHKHAAEALLKNEIDIYNSQFPFEAGEKFHLHVINNYQWQHLDFNLYPINREFGFIDLSKKDIRKALLMAIDRKKLIHSLYSNYGCESHSYIHPESELYNKEIEIIEYNLEKAKQIIQEYFKALNAEKGVNELSIRIATNKDSELTKITLEYIKASWELLGIKVIPQYLSSEEILDVLQKGEVNSFDTILFIWDNNPAFEKGELYTSQTTSGSNIPSLDNNYKGLNVTGWRNEKYTQLYKRALLEFNLDLKKELFKSMQNLFVEEIPSIPLYFCNEFLYVHKNLKNYNPNSKYRDITQLVWEE